MTLIPWLNYSFLSVCVLSLIDISFIGCYNTSFGSYHWAFYLCISNRFIMRASFNTQMLIYLFYIVIEVWSERVWDWLTILQLNWTSDSIVHWPNRLMWFFLPIKKWLSWIQHQLQRETSNRYIQMSFYQPESSVVWIIVVILVSSFKARGYILSAWTLQELFNIFHESRHEIW